MADETQTDTTDNQSSQTQASDAPAPGATGEADATQSTGAADAGDDDSSLLGGAQKTDAADGSDTDGADKGNKSGDGDKATADVPEAYELKVTTKADDGSDVEVEIDAQLLTEATPVLKELGLSNEAANKLAPLALKVQDRVLQTQNDDFTALKAQWAKEAQADAEIGGAKWKETEALAARVLDQFGAPSEKKEVDGKMVETNPFRVLLNESGFGNHPETIRMFRRIGEAIGEDTKTLVGGGAAPAKRSMEEEQYPDDVPTAKQGAK